MRLQTFSAMNVKRRTAVIFSVKNGTNGGSAQEAASRQLSQYDWLVRTP